MTADNSAGAGRGQRPDGALRGQRPSAIAAGKVIEARFSCDALEFEWVPPAKEQDTQQWNDLREDVCADGPPKPEGIAPGAKQGLLPGHRPRLRRARHPAHAGLRPARRRVQVATAEPRRSMIAAARAGSLRRRGRQRERDRLARSRRPAAARSRRSRCRTRDRHRVVGEPGVVGEQRQRVRRPASAARTPCSGWRCWWPGPEQRATRARSCRSRAGRSRCPTSATLSVALPAVLVTSAATDAS